MLPWLLAAILGAGGPAGQMTIRSGDLQATMGESNSWTIITMECDGMPVTVNSGGQGAVVNPRDIGWTGGSMGGNSVERQSVSIDGEECLAFPEAPQTTPVTIVMQSRLATIDHTSTTECEEGVIRQTNEFSFPEDINLGAFYPFIYSFSPQFTDWLAIPATGDPTGDEFTGEGGHHLNAEVPAFALYNEAAGKGVVVYLQQSPGGAVVLWDQTGYRKFWLQPTKGDITAGTEFTGTMLLACFDGGDDWQSAAVAVATDLKERYPMEEAAAIPNQLYDEGVPEVGMMTVQTENLSVKLEAPSAWTIDEIHWDGFKVAGPTGHYGTVLVPAGGKWIGTGHSEGGREVVHELQFSVDGAERPVEPGATLEGEEFELVKHSTIHKFDAEHTINITDSEIVQRAVLRATEAHRLSLMYLFMHCIEPATPTWAAETADGEFVEGTFQSDGGFELEDRARWAAQHFPEQNLSVLLYLTRIPDEEGSMLRMWDEERYHKFYVQHNTGLDVAEGDELDYTLVFTVVENETGDWAATRARAEELKAAYPPVDVE